jgi:AraC-like DNA-binding protein
MNQNGQHAIARIPFRPSPGGPPGLDIREFAELRARAEGHGVDLGRPMRAEFHHLITVRTGSLRHWVDGAEHLVLPGRWLWIHPGQVHSFDQSPEAADGTILMFMPGFFDASTVDAVGLDPSPRRGLIIPDRTEQELATRLLALLREVYYDTGSVPLATHIELVRHLASALLLRLAHLRDRQHAEAPSSDTFRRFHEALERDFTVSHTVDEYAQALGYSVRTLTRACLAAAGRTAKQYLDDRVLLEAKRLLVHTDLAPARIAEQLGFTSATVFTKFFRRCSGETPTAFRHRARIGG